jgi:hypothetical protein
MMEIDVAELYGTYVAEYPFGTEKIVLQKNGRYSQEVLIKADGKITVQTERWEYDREANRVYLRRCLLVADGLGGLRKDYTVPMEGGCSFPVERRYFLFGPLRLGPDEGNPMNKQ